MLLDSLYGKQPSRLWPAHTPKLIMRAVVREIETSLPEMFQETSSHRFRSDDDFLLWIFYPFHLMEAPHHRARHHIARNCDSPRDYAFIAMKNDSTTLERLVALKGTPPKFFCVADELDDNPADQSVLNVLEDLLETLFPVPASFERGADSKHSLISTGRISGH